MTMAGNNGKSGDKYYGKFSRSIRTDIGANTLKVMHSGTKMDLRLNLEHIQSLKIVWFLYLCTAHNPGRVQLDLCN